MSLIPYALARPILFSMDPETAHERTLEGIARLQHSPLTCLYGESRAGLGAWSPDWGTTADGDSGAVVSSTVMTCSQLLELLHSSVAVQVRVIVSEPPQPGAELSLDTMDVTSPQLSLPVALPLAPTPVSVGH